MHQSSMGGGGPGGNIPPCFAFRVRPRPASGAVVGAASPWPVLLRHIGSDRRRDLLAFDSSVFARSLAGPDGTPPLGPYVIDPDGQLPGWSWDVQWCDQEGDAIIPPADGVDSQLGGALRVASRSIVLWDSGIVGGGLVITSPVLDLTPFSSVLAVVLNSDTNTRNLTMNQYLDDGVTLIGITPALTQNFPGYNFNGFGMGAGVVGSAKGFSAPLPTKGSFSLAAGTANNGRVTLIGK